VSQRNDAPELTPLEQLRNDFQNKLQHEKQEKQQQYQWQQNPRPNIRWKPENSVPSVQQRVTVEPHANRTYSRMDLNANNRSPANNRVTHVNLNNNQRDGVYLNKIRYKGQYRQVNGRRDKEPKILSNVSRKPIELVPIKNSAGRDRAHSLKPIAPSTNWTNQLANEKRPEYGNTYTVNMAKQPSEQDAGRHLPIQRRSTRVIRPIDKMSPWQPPENSEIEEDDDSHQHLTAEEKQQLKNLKQKQTQQLSKYRKIEEDKTNPNRVKIPINDVANSGVNSRVSRPTFTYNANKADSPDTDEVEIPMRQVTDDSKWMGRTQKVLGRRDTSLSEALESDSSMYPMSRRKLRSTENIHKDENQKLESRINQERDNESRGELSEGLRNRLPTRSRLKSRTESHRSDGLASQQTQQDDQEADIRLKKKKIFERQRLLSRQFSEDDEVDESALREKEEALQKLIRQHSVELSNLKRGAYRIHRAPEVGIYVHQHANLK